MIEDATKMKNQAFQNNNEELEKILTQLFPEPIVIRSQVTIQSQGLISSRTLANYDSSPANNGVPGRFCLNGKVCYWRDEFIKWMLGRSRLLNNRVKSTELDDILNS